MTGKRLRRVINTARNALKMHGAFSLHSAFSPPSPGTGKPREDLECGRNALKMH